MINAAKYLNQTVRSEFLQAGLTASLSQHFSAPCDIVSLQRDISEYSSSFSIEELKVELDNGLTLNLMFKDLSRRALLEDARQTRPEFLLDPRREIEVYRSILYQYPMGTAKFYGSFVEESNDRFWLFLERVPALELYQVGEFNTWLMSARWLARLHRRFEEEIEALVKKAHLVCYDRDFYELWPSRAVAFSQHHPRSTQTAIRRLANAHDKVVERLLALPTTFIHGDFYASNILVQNATDGSRICPVDWEMAAAGPGLMDLAALVSGKWSPEEQAALVSAYGHVQFPGKRSRVVQNQFLEDLMYCQLHVAIQWLGWSAEWSPPEEHQQDWLCQALQLADRLGL